MAEDLVLLEGPPAVAEVPCRSPPADSLASPAGGEGGVFHNSVE